MSMIVVFSVLLVPTLVLACGFCGGDKAASVYSFKNRQFAERTKSAYVSVELSGDGAEAEFAKAVSALSKIRGVFPKTVRSAYAQRAVSFVHESGIKFDEIARGLSETKPGWSMTLVEEIR